MLGMRRRVASFVRWACPVLLIAVLAGCATAPTSTLQADLEHNRARKAEALVWNARGLEAEGNLDRQEQCFSKAIEIDSYLGEGHNNLGTVYLRRCEYYRAAWEFQYASKLLPHDPRPHYNLGLTFEHADRLDRAIEEYELAHTIDPNNLPVMENLARVYIKSSVNRSETIALLEEALMREKRPEWCTWLREQLVKQRARVKSPAVSTTTYEE